ncbi:MAG: glycosyltransferase family 4 protein [Deltaproteobacteria bacterium]|nr:glycosyltransferase family 4 protein [Deltaproteobacteria bacterium]
MRILINTIPLLSPLSGVGRYTSTVSQYLSRLDTENQYTYFYGFYSDKLVVEDSDSVGGEANSFNRNMKRVGAVKDVIKKIPVLRDVARASKSFLTHQSQKTFDLYFEPNFIPLNVKARKTVVTVHDFSFISNPEWLPKDRANYFNKNFFKKVKAVDKVIVVSDFIKGEAVSKLGLPEDKVEVIHHGYDRSIFRSYDEEELLPVKRKFNLPEKFILSVGSIEPRKNLERMIEAYFSLDKEVRKEFKLVLVGFSGWRNRRVMKLLKEVGDEVVYLGYVSDVDLGKLYNLATLFIFPTLYEGFGLPALEAMASGCPSVVSNVASLPEVCGDAVRYVEPLDVGSISDGIRDVIENESLRNNLKAKGLKRANLFSWPESAKKHMDLFNAVLRSAK